MPDISNDIYKSSLQGLRHTYGGLLIRTIAAFFIQIGLSRTLSPPTLGLFAIILLLLSILSIVSDFGFGPIIIRSHTMPQAEVTAVFYFNIAVSLASMLLLLGISPLIARMFHSPELLRPLRVLSVLIVVQTVSAFFTNIHRRDMNFALLQRTTLIAYIAGFLCVGLPLAYLTSSIWSLVAALWIQTIYSATVLAKASSFTPTKVIVMIPAEFFTASARVLISNVSYWLTSNADTWFAGRFLGVAPLGSYNRAVALVQNPTVGIGSALQTVSISSFARLQTDSRSVHALFDGLLTAVVLLTLPGFVLLATVPEIVITTIYGPEWIAAAPALTPIALAMPAYIIFAAAGSLLQGLGFVGREMKTQILTAVVFLLGLIAVADISIAAIAWVLFLAYWSRALILMRQLSITTSMAPENLQSHGLRFFGIAFWVAAIAAFTRRAISTSDLSGFLQLILIATVSCGPVYLLVVSAPRLVLGSHGSQLVQDILRTARRSQS